MGQLLSLGSFWIEKASLLWARTSKYVGVLPRGSSSRGTRHSPPDSVLKILQYFIILLLDQWALWYLMWFWLLSFRTNNNRLYLFCTYFSSEWGVVNRMSIVAGAGDQTLTFLFSLLRTENSRRVGRQDGIKCEVLQRMCSWVTFASDTLQSPGGWTDAAARIADAVYSIRPYASLYKPLCFLTAASTGSAQLKYCLVTSCKSSITASRVTACTSPDGCWSWATTASSSDGGPASTCGGLGAVSEIVTCLGLHWPRLLWGKKSLQFCEVRFRFSLLLV